MNAVVIEHVLVSDLPAIWRAKLGEAILDGGSEVTVHLELKSAPSPSPEVSRVATNNPLFGLWRDRQDMADVTGYMLALRQPRLVSKGSPQSN